MSVKRRVQIQITFTNQDLFKPVIVHHSPEDVLYCNGFNKNKKQNIFLNITINSAFPQ